MSSWQRGNTIGVEHSNAPEAMCANVGRCNAFYQRVFSREPHVHGHVVQSFKVVRVVLVAIAFEGLSLCADRACKCSKLEGVFLI